MTDHNDAKPTNARADAERWLNGEISLGRFIHNSSLESCYAQASDFAGGIANEFSAKLASAAHEIDRLKAELVKAQAENARLLAMLTELYCDPLIGATRAQKIHCALFGQSNALRDLLAPTIELLKDGVLSWEGEGPAISRARFEVEMTRLKAKLEGKV